ncbi:hypothetical protein [Alkalispirochaeta alkalica]|uniref:hypothetical protein n=1 Tax=Alkalispirochaeta alkalica TaxID=46356 RepID=UPI0003802B8F|nr:hypothetical protein [Alkalispirochaeta alkalica]
MTVLQYAILATLTALFFYLILPGAGALWVRRRWRRFRQALFRGASFPLLLSDTSREGWYQLFGRLESLQGEDLLWLDSGAGSVGVCVEDVPLFLFPGRGRSARRPTEPPRPVFWHEMLALAEGTRFYVAGMARQESGQMVFRQRRGVFPLIIIHEGPPQGLLKRVIWAGRQRNEYWNALTPGALTGGFLAQLLIALAALATAPGAALFAIVLALLPVTPLLPPGAGGYYLYRKIWGEARRRRAIRDASRFCGFHRVSARVGARVWLRELTALGILALGMGINSAVIALVLAMTLFAP